MSNINIKKTSKINAFIRNLQDISNEKLRLVQLQKDFQEGKKKQEQLEDNDVVLLKQLYCEQIVELDNLIEYYEAINKK